jgi:hypothetical protein
MAKAKVLSPAIKASIERHAARIYHADSLLLDDLRHMIECYGLAHVNRTLRQLKCERALTRYRLKVVN